MRKQITPRLSAMYFKKAKEAGERLELVRKAALTNGQVHNEVENAHEQMRAEETLHLNESRFRTLANSVPQLIWTNSADGKANYFNHRWYEYSGLSYDQSYGKGWEAIVHPADAPSSKYKWEKALAAGETFETEYRLRRHDGSYCWFIGRNVPLKDDAGKITGWFGSATDIEDLKKNGRCAEAK